MKIDRRGFVASLMVLASPAFGRRNLTSLLGGERTRSNKFIQIFNLKEGLLPDALRPFFLSSFKDFEKLGYAFNPSRFLLNTSSSYVVCPLLLKVEGMAIAEDFLFFQKVDNWQYVGAYNKYELDLFMNLAAELSLGNDYRLGRLLPQLRSSGGPSGSEACDRAELSFRVNLKNKGVEGSLVLKDGNFSKEVFLENELV
jgi:hypothetical protein